MKAVFTGFVLLALLTAQGQARASKTEAVKKAVRDTCNREVPIETLFSATVRAFDCEPDQEVTIGGCRIKCLKNSDGNVVGK